MGSSAVITIHGLCNYLGDRWVQQDLSLSVAQSEIIAIIGPSGVGKTTLLRSILRLQKPTSGHITVLGTNIIDCSDAEALAVQRRWGVMFQNVALFSSLTVLENVLFPLREYSRLTRSWQEEL